MSLPVQYCFAMASTVPTRIENTMASAEISMVLPKPIMMKPRLVALKISIGYASFAGSAATSATPGMSLARGRRLLRRSRYWTRSASGKQMMKYSRQHMM